MSGLCRACDMHIYSQGIYCCKVIKSRAMSPSRSPQCRALSRALMDEMSSSPLFPVGVGGQWLQMTGALDIQCVGT